MMGHMMYDQILNILMFFNIPALFLLITISIGITIGALVFLLSPPKHYTYLWQCIAGLTIPCMLFSCFMSIDAFLHQEISQEKYAQLRSDVQARPEYAPIIAEAIRAERITNAQFDELKQAFTKMDLAIEKKHLEEETRPIPHVTSSFK